MTTRIDPNNLGVPWDVVIVVRGVDVPVLHPERVDADDEPWMRSGLVGLARRLARAAWSLIVGQTASWRAREAVRACMPADFKRLADEMSGAELIAFAATYQQLQQEWAMEHGRRAAERVREVFGRRAPGASPPRLGRPLRQGERGLSLGAQLRAEMAEHGLPVNGRLGSVVPVGV